MRVDSPRPGSSAPTFMDEAARASLPPTTQGSVRRRLLFSGVRTARDLPGGRRYPDADPLRQLSAWLDAARAAGEPMPEAMTLATATADGVPSARVVIVRSL